MQRIAEEIQGCEGQFPVHLEGTCWFVVSVKIVLKFVQASSTLMLPSSGMRGKRSESSLLMATKSATTFFLLELKLVKPEGIIDTG